MTFSDNPRSALRQNTAKIRDAGGGGKGWHFPRILLSIGGASNPPAFTAARTVADQREDYNLLKNHPEMRKCLVTLEGVTLRVGAELLLPDTSWEIRAGENWAILGPNGSGKSALARAIKGDVPYVRGELIRHDPETRGERIGYVSFELQEEILLREERFEDSRFFSGNPGHPLTAGEILREKGSDATVFDCVARRMEILPLLGQGIRTLSNGEIRKVLLARALLLSPKLLILDEPFAGLDTENRKAVADAISSLIERGTQVILVTHRPEEVIPGISHVILIGRGKVIDAGRRGKVLTPFRIRSLSAARASRCGFSLPRPFPRTESRLSAGPLVEMRNVRVAFGDHTVLRDLNWTVRRGESWAVVGPNGSGKTTLLGLITGENLQVYANEVSLFGKKRGEGESVWEIRRRIGFVSPELQFRYRRQVSVREAVLSGFFDSIGLYRKPDPRQEALADRWLESLGLAAMAERPFLRLSYGEKRLALIVRAMVKSPDLLILDEPCQGLDRENRERVLRLMEEIGKRGETALIYVTHHEEEMIPCIGQVLRLERGEGGTSSGAAEVPRRLEP
jgi:molybdate transport system ATP-binding protein